MAQHTGPVIGYFSFLDETSKQEALAFIRENGWTQDDVKLVADKDYEAHLVIAKRKLW
jgi:hypothetical protein